MHGFPWIDVLVTDTCSRAGGGFFFSPLHVHNLLAWLTYDRYAFPFTYLRLIAARGYARAAPVRTPTHNTLQCRAQLICTASQRRGPRTRSRSRGDSIWDLPTWWPSRCVHFRYDGTGPINVQNRNVNLRKNHRRNEKKTKSSKLQK